MNIREYIEASEKENQLDRIVSDGGLCAVFRTIGCIGDSLSSGEFEALDKDGNKSYHDMFEYSWGQFIARDAGCKVYNFSRGGMTASEYWNSFAEENGFWEKDKLCQAYIIALGVNDLMGMKQELGTVGDINDGDYTKNADTFAGYYGRIIQRLKSMQPHARFFLVTLPKECGEAEPVKEAHAALLYDMAEKFDHTYVVDLYKYAPVYDGEFKRKFYLYGHLNPAGYRLTAKMIESCIDYHVRHNPEDFYQIGFIGTEFYDGRLDKNRE